MLRLRSTQGPQSLACALAALGAMCSTLAPAVASAADGDGAARKLEVLERVAAVVNDEAILLSEVRRRAVPFLAQVMQAETAVERETRLDQLYAQILDMMIDETLLQQAAREMKIRVTREEVDQSVAAVRTRSGLSEDAFWDAVRGQGLSETEYRADVRRQALAMKVLSERAGNRVQISEEEVKQRYEELSNREARTLRVRVSHLFRALAADAPAADVAAAKTAIQALRGEATAETFEALVAKHGGGELGWLTEGDLPDALRDAVLGMKPGEISAPVRGPNGYHLLLLHEREQGGGSLSSYADMRAQLRNEMFQQAMVKQQRIILDEFRRDAVIEKRL